MPRVDLGPLSAQQTFEYLRSVMVREFDLGEEEIQPATEFEALDLDSIDAVDLAVSIEEETGFQFDTDDMPKLRTVQDVVDLIRGELPAE